MYIVPTYLPNIVYTKCVVTNVTNRDSIAFFILDRNSF